MSVIIREPYEWGQSGEKLPQIFLPGRKQCWSEGIFYSFSGNFRWTIMAGAGPPFHTFVATKPVEVPKTLINGEKFIKWDEVRILLLLLFILMINANCLTTLTRCLIKVNLHLLQLNRIKLLLIIIIIHQKSTIFQSFLLCQLYLDLIIACNNNN